MHSKGIVTAASIAALLIGTCQAAERSTAPLPLQFAQSIPEEPIYASQLMTPQERDAHRARLRAAASEQERDRIHREHHAQMQARAKERGVTLPDEPPPRGGGAGLGMGHGMGHGMGQGMGSGMRPGPGPGAGPRGGGGDTGN